jgi:hypothetical protein
MRHLTGASLTQNEEVKRISAWAAILFAPTLVGNIYGMNFDYMPELGWRYGYPWRCWAWSRPASSSTWCSKTPLVVGTPELLVSESAPQADGPMSAIASNGLTAPPRSAAHRATAGGPGIVNRR